MSSTVVKAGCLPYFIKHVKAPRGSSWSKTVVGHLGRDTGGQNGLGGWRAEAGLYDLSRQPGIIGTLERGSDFWLITDEMLSGLCTCDQFQFRSCISAALLTEGLLARLAWHHSEGYFHGNIEPGNVVMGGEIVLDERDPTQFLNVFLLGLRPSNLSFEAGQRSDMESVGWLMYWMLGRVLCVDVFADGLGVLEGLGRMRSMLSVRDRGRFLPSRLVEWVEDSMDGNFESVRGMLSALRSICLRWRPLAAGREDAPVGSLTVMRGDDFRVVSTFQTAMLGELGILRPDDVVSVNGSRKTQLVKEVDELSEFVL